MNKLYLDCIDFYLQIKEMNQQSLKSARTTSYSNKKPSKNTSKSIKIHKKNLENTILKMNNSSPLNVNNSILTQRNNAHSKCKAFQSIPQTQTTARLKSSHKKPSKTINKMKTDRKVQYAKLKAKQIQSELSKKNSLINKSNKKSVKNGVKNYIQENNENIPETNRIMLGDDLAKIGTFLSEETQKVPEIKKNSDSYVISQIQKNQKELLQKIGFLQRQNSSLSQIQELKFNEIRNNHQSQVNILKQEMRLLHSKLNQNDSKNTALERKVESNQKQFISLRQKLHQKQIHLINSQNENKRLEEQLRDNKKVMKEQQIKIGNLQNHISGLQKQNRNLLQKLSKHEQQKLYIKQNCTQVLELLREQFGQQFKLFSN